ncbi:hypothetical protein DL764_000296 [Monosporascus ibericus]|uniref:Major facilitator superfamily (MFS) profile domain-containing protein n=1 Tax=Monosporascus ibericus TaxID=155417 RepID=A0A4V1XCU8_9PEZI|nr:hypothetical protein DL764_000296 [Monosporascus ibericus]
MKFRESSAESSHLATEVRRRDSELNVDNPFKPLTDAELVERVERFAAAREGLGDHLELLTCGARLAKDDRNALDHVAALLKLTEQQKAYLRTGEKNSGLWEQSKYLKGSLLSAALAGIIQFLMKQGRHRKALDAFTLVRPSPVSNLLAARDFVYAHFQLQAECESINPQRGSQEYSPAQGASGPEPLPLSRRALICASIAMLSQQLTGINTMVFLSATMLRTADSSSRTAAWVGVAIGLCNFLFGTPAFWLLDRVGRATMLLLGFVPMLVLMLSLAFSFEAEAQSDTRVALVSTFGILFFIAYSPTAGPAPFAISAEVFPLIPAIDEMEVPTTPQQPIKETDDTA